MEGDKQFAKDAEEGKGECGSKMGEERGDIDVGSEAVTVNPAPEVDGVENQQPKTQSSVSEVSSIYLDNDEPNRREKKRPKTVQPRRLTRAERARQEALASFGGTDLASVAVKKRDLREELRRDAKLLEKGETSKNRVIRKTRVLETSEELKSLLGTGAEEHAVNRKRKLQPSSEVANSGANPPKMGRRMTKAERAQQDALQSFGGCGFDDVMATSRKKIAKTFEMKKPTKTTEGDGEGEGEEEREGEGEGEGEKENVGERATVES